MVTRVKNTPIGVVYEDGEIVGLKAGKIDVNAVLSKVSPNGVFEVPGGYLPAAMFGIKPSNTGQQNSDLLDAAIQKIVASDNNGQGGILLFGRGEYFFSRKHVLPNRFAISGQGRRTTILSVTTPFTGDCLFQLGPEVATGTFAFDCYIEDCLINLKGTSGLIGVNTKVGQEGTGMRHAGITGVGENGIGFQAAGGQNANLILEDIEVYTSTGSGNALYGLNLDNLPRMNVVNKITVVGRSRSFNNGIRVDTGSLVLFGAHFEGCTSGLYVSGTNTVVSAVGVSGLNTSPITNVVEVVGTARRVTLQNIVKGGATNSILSGSTAITDTYVAMYISNNETGAGVYYMSGAKDLCGTIPPEGTVVANRGSIYRRTTGAAGSTLYVKVSGDGLNTGWVAIA